MNGMLPSWLERLFGIETEAGEGTAWRLTGAWPLPAWATLVLIVLSVVAVVTVYLHENREATRRYRMALAAMRLTLVALVLLMIGQLTLSLERTGLPYVVVVLDESLSMGTIDRYDEATREALTRRVEAAGFQGLTRINLVKTLLVENDGALLAGIAGNYKLRVYYLTGPQRSTATTPEEWIEEIRKLPDEGNPQGTSTQLGAVVEKVLADLRGTAPAAIVLMTDGINTEGPGLAEAARRAASQNVRLFTVAVGDRQPVCDLELADLLVDDVVFVNDVVLFDVKLTGIGCTAREVEVVLRHRGSPQPLASVTTVVGGDGQPQRVTLPYRPPEASRPGEKFEYVVEVEPLEEELNTGNNRVSRRVKVTDQKTRVLLVQAYPNFEYRYLENLLTHGDHTIELRTVLQEADPDHAAQDDAALGGFPVRKDDLFSYDVIIFGDADPSLLSNAMLENIAEFVDSPAKGGGLVFIAGPRFNPLAYRGTPLEKLLPIDLTGAGYPEPGQPLTEGFVVRPTEAGLAIGPMQLGDTPRETRDIWPRLAPLYWMLEAPELKDGARVLAVHPRRLGHDGRPLAVICMQHVGAGKVLFHATDETWRWRRRVGDVFLARYWIQMIRFLSRPETSGPAPPVKLSALKPKYRHGETVRLRLKFFDPREAPADDNDVTVMLQHEGGQTQRLPMFRSPTSRGVFEGEVVDPPTGRCHAWLVTPDLGVRTAADDFVVEPPQGETEQIRTDVEALRRAATETKGRSYTMEDAEKIPGELPEGRRVAIETLDSIVLWNRWPVLLLFLGILIGEWLLRKRRFMV